MNSQFYHFKLIALNNLVINMIRSKENQDHWDQRIRIISKIFGFEDYCPEQNDAVLSSTASTISKPSQKSKGILILKNHSKSMHILQKREYKNLASKRKWDQLMKKPIKLCRADVLSLLKQEVPIYNKVLAWLLKDSQKINPKLYNMRKTEFLQITQGKRSVQQTGRVHSLATLNQIIKHQAISNLIGSMLLHRQDLSYSVALYNMAASFYYYCQSNQMSAFTILAHASVSEAFLPFLSKDQKEVNNHFTFIIRRLRFCCPSMAFINNQKNIQIQGFISAWIQSFFFPISQNGTSLKQIILCYLVFQNFSKSSVSRICEATIISLAKIINQGNRQKCIEVLNNPKIYMEENLFKQYLLQIS